MAATLPSHLRASGRAAYRYLLRSASSTFSGDDRMLTAMRLKAREAFIEGRSITDASQYEERINLAREVADVLNKNVVQGTRTSEEDVWKIHFRPTTELGDNETIKNPTPPKPRERKRPDALPNTSPTASIDDIPNSVPNNKPLSLAARMKAHKERVIPELREEDLEESFVRGSGPGGQAINKTSSSVSLIHLPTGIRVQCQETRSLQTNRRLARRNLAEKLDKLQNPGLSKEEMKWAKVRERKRQKRRKSQKKMGDVGKSSEEEEDI